MAAIAGPPPPPRPRPGGRGPLSRRRTLPCRAQRLAADPGLLVVAGGVRAAAGVAGLRLGRHRPVVRVSPPGSPTLEQLLARC